MNIVMEELLKHKLNKDYLFLKMKFIYNNLGNYNFKISFECI